MSIGVPNEPARMQPQSLARLIEAGDVDALAAYLHDDFRHHRPDSAGAGLTKAEWLAAVRAALGPIAGTQVEILHLLADDDHVVLHSRRRLPDGPEIVVVDIWRLDDVLIAEAWEIIEPVAQAAANLVWWDAPGGQVRDAEPAAVRT